MSRVILYPFPRLPDAALRWSEWVITANGARVNAQELCDLWDANSELDFAVKVSIRLKLIAPLKLRHPELVLTVSCSESAFSCSQSARLIQDRDLASASTSVTVRGVDIAQSVQLRAQIIDAPPEAELALRPWMSRLVLAELPAVTVPLVSDLTGFPTSAQSFRKSNLPQAPWRIAVNATELSDSFSNSVRLYLNVDYPVVQELIDGKPRPYVETELSAAITRVLLSAARKLHDEGALNRAPSAIATEYPESVAAAAERASEQYLRMSLNEAISEMSLRPDSFEYRLAVGLGSLKEKA